jgi:hypothetical protein
VFKEVNQTALMNKVILYISISDGSKDADFYLEQLEENKYFNPTSYKLRNDNGTAVLDIPVRGGVALNKRINIIAKVKTNYSNNLILQATYTLTKK